MTAACGSTMICDNEKIAKLVSTMTALAVSLCSRLLSS
jgi:hypothetical protein